MRQFVESGMRVHPKLVNMELQVTVNQLTEKGIHRNRFYNNDERRKEPSKNIIPLS